MTNSVKALKETLSVDPNTENQLSGVILSFYLPIVQLFYLVSLSNTYMCIVIDFTGI